MTDTTNLGLPLVQAAQAQKHVTVNEALTRLDALVRLRIIALDAVTPPVVPVEGGAYALGTSPTGVWAGQGGKLALSLDGLWHFVVPAPGWQAWDTIAGGPLRFDGGAWIVEGPMTSSGGAATVQEVIEFDQVLGGTGPVDGDVVIPAGAQVIGVTGRVIAEITGPGLTGWRVGADGSDNRYGSGIGLTLNSWARGLTGQPLTYYSDTALQVTPEGGADFVGGVIRLAIHLVRLDPPRPV